MKAIRSRSASLLLQPLDLQPVGNDHRRKGLDRSVEIAVLLTQTLEFKREFALFGLVQSHHAPSEGNVARSPPRCPQLLPDGPPRASRSRPPDAPAGTARERAVL